MPTRRSFTTGWYAESVLGKIVNWDFVEQNLDGQGASRADQETASDSVADVEEKEEV